MQLRLRKARGLVLRLSVNHEPMTRRDQAMTPSITLSARDRNALLRHYRHSRDPQLRTRAHIILLLADGRPWALIAALLYTSSSTIDRWQRRFRTGGLPALFGPARGATGRADRWAALIVGWVLTRAPADLPPRCLSVEMPLHEGLPVRCERPKERPLLVVSNPRAG